jgi:hypothetical protein
MIDRTSEFQGCIRVLRRGSDPADVLQQQQAAAEAAAAAGGGEFAQAVAHIAAGFEGTSKLNEQLMRLVSRKGNSNDPTAEISDVSRLFKGDMDSLQRELSMLQAYVEGTSGRRGGPAAGTQRQKHCSYIVAALNQTAQQQTQSFQAALKQRTTVLKEQNERRKHYSHTRNVGLKVQLKSPLFGMSNGSSSGGPARPATAPLSAPNSAGTGSGHLQNHVHLMSALPLSANSAGAPNSIGHTPAVAAAAAARSPLPPHQQQQQQQQQWRPPPPTAASSSVYQSGAAAAGAANALPLPGTLSSSSSSKGPATVTPPPSGGGSSMGLRRRGGAAGDVYGQSDLPNNSAWQVQELQQHSANRLDEARRVESMIGELGSMFSKFSTLVAQQEELVVHIEDDVEMAQGFAVDGQAHLARYYSTISGNRGLIIKIFIALAFFIWLFTVVT